MSVTIRGGAEARGPARKANAATRLIWLTLGFVASFGVLEWIRAEIGDGQGELTKLTRDLVQFGTVSVVSFIFSNIFFEFYMKRDVEENVEKAISIALDSNADSYLRSIARMDDGGKQQFIRKALSVVGGSLLGRDSGDLLWTDLLGRYVEKRGGFRRNFNYRIDIREARPGDAFVRKAQAIGLIADAGKFCAEYLLCRQEIRYSKDDGVARADGMTEVIFTFDPVTLQNYMARGDVYFRDCVLLKGEIAKSLETLDDRKLENWVREGWAFEATCARTREALDYEVSFVGSGRNRVISIAVHPSEKIGADQLLTLTFVMPHLRSDSHYLVMLPEPIEDPEIDFQIGMDDMCAREFVFFGARETPIVEQVPQTNPAHIKIRGRGWTFPTSGVLFVWRNV